MRHSITGWHSLTLYVKSRTRSDLWAQLVLLASPSDQYFWRALSISSAEDELLSSQAPSLLLAYSISHSSAKVSLRFIPFCLFWVLSIIHAQAQPTSSARSFCPKTSISALESNYFSFQVWHKFWQECSSIISKVNKAICISFQLYFCPQFCGFSTWIVNLRCSCLSRAKLMN